VLPQEVQRDQKYEEPPPIMQRSALMKIFLKTETVKPQLIVDRNFNPILAGSQEQKANYLKNKRNF